MTSISHPSLTSLLISSNISPSFPPSNPSVTTKKSLNFSKAMTKIPILHFNDVYRVSPQKVNRSGDTIDVTQFAALVDKLRGRWGQRTEDGKSDGLFLFSGDLFSPSVESSVTRGSHMVSMTSADRFSKPSFFLLGTSHE